MLALVDGAVYTSEVPWTKPAREAFEAAMAAVGVTDPAACVFVGGPALRRHLGRRQRRDAARCRCRTATFPLDQAGPSVGEPDAVAHRLAEVYDVVAGWR